MRTPLIFLAALLLLGCQSDPVQDASAPLESPGGHARLTILDTRTPDQPVGADQLSINVAPALRHIALEGPRTRLTTRRPAAGGTSVDKVLYEGPSGAPLGDTRQTLELLITPAGDSAVVSTAEQADSVVTYFDPPLIAVPAQLQPGQTFTQNLGMRVYPIKSPDRLKTKGHGTQEVTFAARERVRVPAGEFDAARLDSLFGMALDNAKVTVKTTSWYAEGVGLIAERSSERVTVFGLNIRSRDEAWALDKIIDPGTPGTAAIRIGRADATKAAPSEAAVTRPAR